MLLHPPVACTGQTTGTAFDVFTGSPVVSPEPLIVFSGGTHARQVDTVGTAVGLITTSASAPPEAAARTSMAGTTVMLRDEPNATRECNCDMMPYSTIQEKGATRPQDTHATTLPPRHSDSLTANPLACKTNPR